MQSYQNTIKEICEQSGTNLETGLSKKEAQARLKAYGRNTIKEHKGPSILSIFFSQFLSPLMYVLLFAAAASMLIGEPKDAIVIGIAVIINVIIGFIQEWKAERAATALKAYEVHLCQVKREGAIVTIESQYLVPGDIVLLSAGSRIPADIRLSYAVDFAVEEALLTGESEAIEKIVEPLPKDLPIGDRKNMGYSGTYVISGKAEGIVVATGSFTELGKIAQLIIETKEEKTPLQKQIKRFSWLLGLLILTITIIVALLAIVRNYPLVEVVTTAIALAVASIPEGLLVAVTVVLAIGMQRMLKRKALVRHLIAAETLGSVSIICTDKTGTLTKGHMAVTEIKTPHVTREELLIATTLNNDSHITQEGGKRVGNPTEIALLEAAAKHNIDIAQTRKRHKRTDETPFSSDLKYMATVHEYNGTQRLIVKGAFGKIIPMCALSEKEKESLRAESDILTKKGLRLIVVAYKDQARVDLQDDLHGLTYMGLIGLQDPLRKHAAKTVEELQQAGIRTVVVTGDQKHTATNIAQGAGLAITPANILTGAELEKISDASLTKQIETIDLFARVDPSHKIRIVKAWQARGESVAMIGDGVNDAPALKAANVGVALGSGSDVAHEISDIVLLDNNLSTISAAVRQGRIIFENIRKIIVYLMADSFGEIVLVFGALLLKLPLPILATQILWINLITDGFPYMALTVEPGEPEVMKEKPRPKDEPILNTQMKTLIFIIGIVTDIGLFGLYFWLLQTSFTIHHIRTIMFTALSINSLFYVFSVRTMRSSLFRSRPFANYWLNLSVIAGFGCQLCVIYLPVLQRLFSTVSLGMHEWLIITGLALIKLIGIELTKECFIRWGN